MRGRTPAPSRSVVDDPAASRPRRPPHPHQADGGEHHADPEQDDGEPHPRRDVRRQWQVVDAEHVTHHDRRSASARADSEWFVRHDVDARLLLRKTVGLEDAPAAVIKQEQDVVRRTAIDTGEHELVHTRNDN